MLVKFQMMSLSPAQRRSIEQAANNARRRKQNKLNEAGKTRGIGTILFLIDDGYKRPFIMVCEIEICGSRYRKSNIFCSIQMGPARPRALGVALLSPPDQVRAADTQTERSNINLRVRNTQKQELDFTNGRNYGRVFG